MYSQGGAPVNYCTRCGRPLEADSESCTGCGARTWHRGATRKEVTTRRKGVPRWVMLTGAAVLLGIVGLAGVIGFTHLTHANQAASLGRITPAADGSAGGSANPPASSPQPAASQPSSPPLSAEQAARSLARLLAQSETDRAAVNHAFSDVLACGSGLAQDVQTFQHAATSRKQLLSQLAVLPGSPALPAPLRQDLSGAWRASHHADRDYASWAAAENASGCTANDTANSWYQAAAGPDSQATTYKQDFVRLWNSIASQYGLSTYQWSDL
jgi:hypothetical protein